MLSGAQENYVSTFAEEIFRELQFIVDVSRGRAKARESFFDKLIGNITLGSAVIGALTGFFPLASVAVGALSQVVICTAVGLKYLYEADIDINVKRVETAACQPEIILRILLECVAREAARRYEFFLNNVCEADAIDLFAAVGVARVLQYLSDNKDIVFSAENLLLGLTEGKSGAGIQGYHNNQIPCRHFRLKYVSAETVYSHSALMSSDGLYYIKRSSGKYFKRSPARYVKMLDQESIPKAGVMVFRRVDINRYLNEYEYINVPIPSEVESYIENYRPGYVLVGREKIVEYMAVKRGGTDSNGTLSLRKYCGDKSVICTGNLSGLDLDGGDFSSVEFSCVQFSGSKLNHANFERAFLAHVDFSDAEVSRVNFRHAKLYLITACNTSFVESDFTSAMVYAGSFDSADMSGLHSLGSLWTGSDLSSIVSSSEVLDDLRSTQLQKALLEQQQMQLSRLQELEIKISAYLKDQSQRVSQSVRQRLLDIQRRVLDDEDLKQELECYIPVLAANSQYSTEHFDLEEKISKLLSKSDKKVLLVLGGAGEGKSTFNRYLHKSLWSSYKDGDAVPVFISLPSMSNPVTMLMNEYFESEHFSSEDMAYMQANKTFVLILDGYDEMNTDRNLYVTNKLSQWKAKVIISCRTQYLAQFSEYKDCFIPIFGEKMLTNSFLEFCVMPFNKGQIDSYIEKFVKLNNCEEGNHDDEIEQYKHHIASLPGVVDLVATPFLLMITLKVMPDIVRKYAELEVGMRAKLTQTELYDTFMQWWFRRGKIKAFANTSASSNSGGIGIGNRGGYIDITVEFQAMSEALAAEMIHADVMQVRYQTSDRVEGKVFGWDLHATEIRAVTSACLSEVVYEDKAILLLCVYDCTDVEKMWRIVGKNNAGGVTYNPQMGWLTVHELHRRWSVRKVTVAEHREQAEEKVKAMEFVVAQLLLAGNSPENLSRETRSQIFEAIILALAHPWEYFFDLDNPRTQRLLPGIPVKPASDKGGYSFIHSEILKYFFARSIKREEMLVLRSAVKPWQLPQQSTASSSSSSSASNSASTMKIMPPPPAAVPQETSTGSGAGNTTIIYQTIIQQAAPVPTVPVQMSSNAKTATTETKRQCTVS